MAIIYTYPIKSDPSSGDILLISDVEDGNKTKQVTIADIRGATVSGVSSIIAGTPNVTLSPASGTGDVTISVSSTSTPPGGADTEIQYNNGGAFGGTTGLEWDNSTNILSIATRYEGDINGAVLQQVLVKEPGGVSKGDVVYISGGTGDNPEVMKAQANSVSTMAALGIMKENVALDVIGECITSGEITGLNLTGFTTGDELFVSDTTAGELITSAPTSEANLIQKIGKVIKGGAGGALTVLGAFRTNATPNLNEGSIFIGDASNQSSVLSISASSGDVLTSNGTTASWQALPAGKTYTLSAPGAPSVGTIRLSDGTVDDDISITGGTGITLNQAAPDNINVSLSNIAGVSGSYTNANITVDGQGRITNASSGAAASVNGELLYSTNWETTTGSDTNPSIFSVSVFSTTGDTLEQLEFDPGTGGTGTGTQVYGFCDRPEDEASIVRVVVQFTAESSTAGDEKTAVGLHHDSTDQTGAALDYGWHTVGDMDEGSLGNLVRYKYTFDIPVGSLLNSGGTSAAAGDPCFFYVKARSFGAAPDIVFGARYTSNPSTTLASSQNSAGPCIVDVYEIQDSKYVTNPTPI